MKDEWPLSAPAATNASLSRIDRQRPSGSGRALFWTHLPNLRIIILR
jgi:hypothetical protein